MSYRIEEMPNGLTYVFSYRSGLSACYTTASGAYAFGDLRAATLADLLREGTMSSNGKHCDPSCHSAETQRKPLERSASR